MAVARRWLDGVAPHPGQGEAMRLAHQASGLSWSALARAVGRHRRFLLALQAGEKKPSLKTVVLIKAKTGIDIPLPRKLPGSSALERKRARLASHGVEISDLELVTLDRREIRRLVRVANKEEARRRAIPRLVSTLPGQFWTSPPSRPMRSEPYQPQHRPVDHA